MTALRVSLYFNYCAVNLTTLRCLISSDPIFYPSSKTAHDTRDDYIRNLAMAGSVAHRSKLPLWLYFNIVPYRRLFLEDPTEAQVRWQISIALAYGATGLLYFQWHPMSDGHPG